MRHPLFRPPAIELTSLTWKRPLVQSEYRPRKFYQVRVGVTRSDGQALSYRDAITILEQVVADSERILGPGHPDTLTAVSVLKNWKEPPESRGRGSPRRQHLQ